MYITGREGRNRKKVVRRGYTGQIHTDTEYRYTLTLQPARLHPKLSKEKRVVSLKSPQPPNCSFLLLILGFLSTLIVALQQIHSLLVSRVLAKYCLATQRMSRRGGGITEGLKSSAESLHVTAIKCIIIMIIPDNLGVQSAEQSHS